MNIKNLSSKQVHLAQELSRYHFQIDYHQDKANGTTDTFSRYPQQNIIEEVTLQVKNTKILYCLQSSLAKISELSASNLLPLY